MKQYIIRRLLQMIPVLFGITVFIFFLFKLAPGDPISTVIGRGVSAETKAEIREQMGLNKPIITQYGIWLGKAVRGDLGESSYFKQPVGRVMNDYIWNSFLLAVFSYLFAILLSIPIGVISATRQYSAFDSFFTVIAFIGISIPAFFFGLLLIKWFAVDMRILPVSGMRTAGSELKGAADLIDVAKHMLLPLIVLTFGTVAVFMRYIRSSMLEVIRQDYIRTARAKGLKEKVVIYKHALRNAMIPVITLLGLSLSGLFAGAIITESIFLWPGIGPVQLLAVSNRDYNLLMGYNLLIAVLTLFGNLLADIIYAIVDPRIRYK
jgi:peptide/nickel transport system permease protein